jgi:hypothetical protein
MFTEDLSVFFDSDDFAIAATFTPTSGAASTPSVIFDAAFVAPFAVAGTNPVALARAADFPATTSVGGTIVINGISYTIRSREPQDDGAIVLLQLETA